MNIDWKDESEKILVPKDDVSQAIKLGIIAGRKEKIKRRRRLVLLSVAAALLLFATRTTPVLIQAGGIVPSIQQLLDHDSRQTPHFDPTMNELLGDPTKLNQYQTLDLPTKRITGLTIQVKGALTSAGVAAVVVDYTGAKISPTGLRQQRLELAVNGQPINDVEQNIQQVAIGHYRSILAFYVTGVDLKQSSQLAISIGHLNGSREKVSLPLVLLRFADVQTNEPNLTITSNKPSLTAKLIQIQQTTNSMVVRYQVSFDRTQFSKAELQQYYAAAWLSEATVYQNDQKVGELNLGVSGQQIKRETNGSITTLTYESVFSTHLSSGAELAKNQTIIFKLMLPGVANQRITVGQFKMNTNLLIDR
ncbi:hypothetical protein [Lapidilactobacillus wuchangensis]|uniref:hypothetical protein n=1 Tax=Lapidilactobacillus wuchangensis TaxID=2486001 RepID=UPI000F7B7CC3|nr:hypothetical protein [Lapidilactobacillus wuchangensis]